MPAQNPGKSQSITQKKCDPVEQTILWLLEGNRTPDIVEAIKENHPGDDPEKTIKAALAHFAEVGEADTTIIKGWCFEAYRELYRRMVDVGDYKGAIAAIKELRKECS